MELIVAIDCKGGMGLKGSLPWHNKQDLAIFKAKTMGKILVVGRKTAETLPLLPGREIMCITRNPSELDTNSWKNDISLISGDLSNLHYSSKDVVIAGGSQIYQLALENKYDTNLVTKVHISILNDEYECDTFFNIRWLKDFVITETTLFGNFKHLVMERTTNGERQYLDLCEKILDTGETRIGRNGNTISLFKNDLKFDLRNGFPLLTTKKMFTRGIIEELLFFMKGQTDGKILEEKKVNIWKGNTSREYLDSIGMTKRREGVLGPCYGYQWRYFNAPYDETAVGPCGPGVDQLQNVVDMIKNDPTSRRIMMTAFNPEQLPLCVLPPCHSVFTQFYVSGDFLDMYAVNRSSDVFLGLPFNIASYALFQHVVAELTGKIPRYLDITLGDTHIYEEHTQQVLRQITRFPYKFPTIKLPEIKDLNSLHLITANDFIISDYVSHQKIKGDMVV